MQTKEEYINKWKEEWEANLKGLVGSTIIKVEAITTKHDEDIYYIHLCNGKILTGIDGEYGSDALSILDEPEEVKSRRTL